MMGVLSAALLEELQRLGAACGGHHRRLRERGAAVPRIPPDDAGTPRN
jgi:hypothetical protein